SVLDPLVVDARDRCRIFGRSVSNRYLALIPDRSPQLSLQRLIVLVCGGSLAPPLCRSRPWPEYSILSRANHSRPQAETLPPARTSAIVVRRMLQSGWTVALVPFLPILPSPTPRVTAHGVV